MCKYALHIFQHLQIVVLAFVRLNDRLLGRRTIIFQQILWRCLFKQVRYNKTVLILKNIPFYSQSLSSHTLYHTTVNKTFRGSGNVTHKNILLCTLPYLKPQMCPSAKWAFFVALEQCWSTIISDFTNDSYKSWRTLKRLFANKQITTTTNLFSPGQPTTVLKFVYMDLSRYCSPSHPVPILSLRPLILQKWHSEGSQISRNPRELTLGGPSCHNRHN